MDLAMISFGEWVQKRRNRLGLTRRELAQGVGCSPATIKKVERDERRPSIQIAELLADNLQIPQSSREDFIIRARGEFVPHFGSHLEMSPAEAQSSSIDEEAPKHNLPPQTMSFVGRGKELVQVHTNLADPNCRLLTILGTGGMGKTRLAIAAAAAQLPNFTDGITYVALAPITPSRSTNVRSLIVNAIGEALTMSFHGEDSADNQLLNYLRRKELLLVLDNIEHLLESRDFVDELIQHAPDVKLLVTSRVRLHLQEEWLFSLQGLPYPSEKENASKVPEFSAVQLFNQRARQVKPTFDLNKDIAAVIKICQLVEGMPLGIELAASWTNILSISQISYEIQNNINFLSTTAKNVPSKHRSMRAIFDGSWQLLSKEEKQLFGQLSIFRGGFRLDAAIIIFNCSPQRLATFVHKSILKFDSKSTRYTMHELLRQYGEDKFSQASIERNVIKVNFAKYYIGYLSKLMIDLKGENNAKTLAAISEDYENMHNAWLWLIENKHWELLQNDGIEAFGHFYQMKSRYQDGLNTFHFISNYQNGLDLANQHKNKYVHILAWQAVFYRLLGKRTSAESILLNCLSIINEADLQRNSSLATIAFVHFQIGNLYLDSQREKAKHHLEKSLTIYQDLDDTWGLANVFRALGNVTFRMSQYQESSKYRRKALEIFRELDFKPGIARLLSNLSFMAIYNADEDLALRLALESIDIYKEIGDYAKLADGQSRLGITLLRIGKFQEAETVIYQSLKNINNLGNKRLLSRTYVNLAVVKGNLGKLDEGYELGFKGLKWAKSFNSISGNAYALWALSIFDILNNNFSEAWDKAQKSAKIYEELGQPGELGWAKANSAYAAVFLGELETSKMILYDTLKTAIQIREPWSIQVALGGIALIFAKFTHELSLNNKKYLLQRAIEIYTVAGKLPNFGKSAIYNTVPGGLIKETTQKYLKDEMSVIVDKAKSYDLWETANELLEELKDMGWGV